MNSTNTNLITKFIHTKMNKPGLRKDWLKRERLTNRLDQGKQSVLILVSAPAGYGKSVLVTQWLNSQKAPSSWLSLDVEDNDYLLFLEYFIATVQKLFPQACLETKQRLKAIHETSVQNLANSLLNELNQIKIPFTIVLDDYHHIKQLEINRLVRLILRYPPSSLHLIIITRRDPALHLATLRAQGQLTEIRTKDLTFTLPETEHLLHQLGEFRVSQDALMNLQNEVEGWVAGLRLIALSLRDQQNPNKFLCHLRGSLSQLQTYLVEEVLACYPPIIRNWLEQTAILNRFCSPLIEAVCLPESPSEQEIVDGKNLVEIVTHGNLFVISLDTEETWYRYHSLFKKLLLKRLYSNYSPETITSLHLRASKWFESQGLIEEAIAHALAVEEVQRAVEIVEEHGMAQINANRWHQLETWLKRLPPQIVQQRSRLLLFQGWILYFRYRLQEIPTIIEQLEREFGDQTLEPVFRAEFNSLKGIVYFWQGEADQSLACFEKTTGFLSQVADRIRFEAELYFGLALYLSGQKQHAIQFFKEKLDLLQPQVCTMAGLVFIDLLSGQLTPAIEGARQVQKLGQIDNNLYITLWGHYLQGVAYWRGNQFDRALLHFRFLADNPYAVDTKVAIDALIGLALTYQALQQTDAASDTIERVIEFAGETGDWEMIRNAYSGRARLALQQGNLCLAYQWVNSFDDSPYFPTMFSWLEIPTITQARVLIAIGSQQTLQEATALLQTLHNGTEALHYTCQTIEIEVLQAVAFDKQGERETALITLKSAIALAESGGLIRPFMESGSAIISLLQQLPAQGSTYYFKKQLLEMLEVPMVPVNGQVAMIESLTQRESEILEMLSQRLQDKEIAKHLNISPTTVKSHLKNIYQKLDVHNRREAVVQGGKFGLIATVANGF